MGRKVQFKVVRAGPTFSKDGEAVYKICVKSSELDCISKKLAGPGYKQFAGGLNIVVGVRKIKLIKYLLFAPHLCII